MAEKGEEKKKYSSIAFQDSHSPMATTLILQHHAKYDASIHLKWIEMKMKKWIKKWNGRIRNTTFSKLTLIILN